jgi:hypothetical protein
MQSRPRFLASLGLLAVAAVVSGPVPAQTQRIRTLKPDCPEPLPPADPTVDLEYGCYYFGNYTWNDGSGAGNVSGRVYWPSDCSGSTPPGLHPLVLLMHGDGHSHLDYGYLMSHLARNGFIAATISNSGSNLTRAGQALTYLSFLRDHWTHRTHISNSIGLIGHSRGGEAVLTVARRIEELGLSHDVDAIISLAPTDNVEGGGLHESIEGGESESYLVIYGTHDEDVLGPCISGTAPSCSDALSEPFRSGFGLFDRAGVESGTEPLPIYDDVVTRAMLFVQGANHNGFRSTCNIAMPPPGQLSCDEHKDVARGYMHAFLRWRLRGEAPYKDFFTGRWTPEAIAAAGTIVRTQYVEGYGRRVVDDFSDASFATNALGGSTWTGGVLQLAHHGPLWQYSDTCPHDTRGAVVQWAPPGFAPYLRLSIPDTQTPFGDRHRDVREFEFLSIRAGQVHGSAYNADETPKDFWIALSDASGATSSWVRASSAAELPYPLTANLVNGFGQTATTVSSAMSTVRVPLCRFAGVDLEDVTTISLWFTVPGSTSGELILDNLEFTD